MRKTKNRRLSMLGEDDVLVVSVGFRSWVHCLDRGSPLAFVVEAQVTFWLGFAIGWGAAIAIIGAMNLLA